MNIDTIFTVKNEHLSRLNEYTAVEFFRKLLWAEARSLGIELNKIKVSSNVKARDDGIDASVNESQITAGSGLIKTGLTHYQIKATKTMPNIKDEIFGRRNDVKKENLKKGIRDCFDSESGGTYILVCTGIDLEYKRYNETLKEIKNYLQQCGYNDPKVDVLSQNNLISFLQVYPSLALSLNGNDKTNFQSHQSWAENDTIKYKYVSGPDQKNLIARIRKRLRTNKEAIHIRILGESGSGKSKLVLNATRVKDLSPLVIYCEASQFKGSDLLNHILRDDNHFDVILVVDECNSRDRAAIWDKLKNRGSRIKLITISNDYEEETADLITAKMPLLKEEYIRKILIQKYQIHDRSIYQWVEFCSGLPGVAHMIGANLNSHQENLLAPLSTVTFWERCIFGGEDPTIPDVADRWPVLRYLALFKQFGFKGNVSGEFSAIAEIVENAFPLITQQRFKKIVLDLKKRGILKGDYTLHITPKVLHIKLWLEWWENYYAEDSDLVELTRGFTPNLFDWFCEMFKYAAESEDALKIVKQLLGPKGPFQSDPFTNNLNSSFFLALTNADPASALECLKQTIGKCDRETLIQLTDRRYVVWALEKIVVWEELFPDAARLLLALGEAENETCSNNASGVFAGLFSPAYDDLAPTAAPPEKRFPILKEAFESKSRSQRLLALEACKIGLESIDQWHRTVGPEYQGLRKPPKLWKPKTYGDLWNVYKQVWELLGEQVILLPIDERNNAINILLEQVYWLGEIPSLSGMVIDTIRTFEKNPFIDDKLLIKTVVEFLHNKSKDLPDDLRQHWEQLEDELVGSDYHSMMQRYVGMNLLIDLDDGDNKILEQGHPKIRNLAQQAINNPKLLESELHWLVTTEAYNGYAFGYQLGKKDGEFVLLSMLLDAQRNVGNNASAIFLGGYFHAIFDGNITEWEKQLDALVEDPKLDKFISELTYRSGLTDRAGLRLLKLAEKGIIGPKYFGFFVQGRAIENLSNNVFNQWIRFLLSTNGEPAVEIALKSYHHYYVFQKTEPILPDELTFRLLTHPGLYKGENKNRFDTMIVYHWTEIGKTFLQIYPEKNLELAKLMLAYLGTRGTIVGGSKTRTESVLTEITKKYPEQVWQIVCNHLDKQDDFSKRQSLDRWLREGDISKTEKGKGALTLFPQKIIWEWVDNNVEKRACLIARRLVPKTLIKEEWPTSLSRAILKRYGTRDDVRHSLISNYSTGVWAGPASSRYDSIKQKLLQIKSNEDDRNVIRWIEDYVEALDNYIEQAKVEEEREQ